MLWPAPITLSLLLALIPLAHAAVDFDREVRPELSDNRLHAMATEGGSIEEEYRVN